MQNRNNAGPRIDLKGTPEIAGSESDVAPRKVI